MTLHPRSLKFLSRIPQSPSYLRFAASRLGGAPARALYAAAYTIEQQRIIESLPPGKTIRSFRPTTKDHATRGLKPDHDIIRIDAPTVFGEHELKFSLERAMPRRFFKRYRNALVYGRTMDVILRKQHQALYMEAERDLAIDARPGWVQQFHPQDGKIIFTPSPQLDAVSYHASAILVGQWHSFNYFHWMVEAVPRLILAEEMGVQPDAAILTGQMPAQHFALLEKLWPERRVVSLAADELTQIKTLYVPHTASYAPESGDVGNAAYDPDYVAKLRATIRPHVEVYWKETAGPLYVSRQKLAAHSEATTNVRTMTNDAELEALVHAEGATIIHPETMTLDAQMEAFAKASYVVMAAGSAIANMIYCRPGTPVIVLAQNTRVNPEYFGILIQACGMIMAVVAGKPMEGGLNAVHGKFEINPDNLREAIRWANAQLNQ